MNKIGNDGVGVKFPLKHLFNIFLIHTHKLNIYIRSHDFTSLDFMLSLSYVTHFSFDVYDDSRSSVRRQIFMQLTDLEDLSIWRRLLTWDRYLLHNLLAYVSICTNKRQVFKGILKVKLQTIFSAWWRMSMIIDEVACKCL